jgi:hypothetical protein
MAGSFGYEKEHYDVSKKIGEERLFPAIEETPVDVQVSVAGVSCRQQIEHFTNRPTRHIAEVLASRLDTSRRWQLMPGAEDTVDEIDPTNEEAVHAASQFSGPA